MEYLSAKEVAEKWNISRRRVQILCEEGRIKGAFKLSDVWVIPKDAEKPVDRRKTKKKASEQRGRQISVGGLII